MDEQKLKDSSNDAG